MNDIDVTSAAAALIPLAATYGLRILGVILLLWVALKVAAWSQDRITRGLRARAFDETLSIFFGSLVRWLIVLATVLACLGVFGIETTSFAAIIGAAGLAVGLAFQGTLSNFASGVMLLVFRPFKVGDLVDIAGKLGFIREVGLFTTSIDTFGDNRRVIIPNSNITSAVIENYDHNAKRRVDVSLATSAAADLDRTRAVLEEAALSVPHRDPGLGHQVIVLAFGPNGPAWQVRVWCDNAHYWTVLEETIRAVKYALDGAGIAIPYTQIDVNLQPGRQPLHMVGMDAPRGGQA